MCQVQVHAQCMHTQLTSDVIVCIIGTWLTQSGGAVITLCINWVVLEVSLLCYFMSNILFIYHMIAPTKNVAHKSSIHRLDLNS